MNRPIMEKFYKIICEGQNLKTALCLKAMVDDLILFRAERIIDKFKSDPDPFHKLFVYQNGAIFQNAVFGEASLDVGIWVEEEIYWFLFTDKNDPEGVKGRPKAMLQKMGCLDDYTLKKGGQFWKGFEFPSQDEVLFKHIADFKKKLKENGCASLR